jgi:glycosyltransferase involved in cell wall biosynthesis
MTVGYLHFGGLMGDAVRIHAIRQFFVDNAITFREIGLEHNRKRVDILRETLSPSGFRHLARKVFIDRAHPFLKEINWHVEVRQWEESVENAARELVPQAHSVDIFHAELIFAGLVGARLKALSGKPYVYDMHGLISEEAKLTGSQEYAQACSRWEREVVTNADRIIVVTKDIYDFVNRVYKVPPEKLTLCPNGTYVKDTQAKFCNPLHVLYAGNFAPYENVMTFMKTAELIASERIRFVLMGDGALRNEIFDYMNKNSVDLVYLGKKKYDQVFDFFWQAQVGFYGGTSLTGSPIKILDYASCGLPIIAGPGPWAETIKKFNSGVIVDEISPQCFADAIKQLNDRSLWEAMSENAKAMIKEAYQWKDLLRPLVDLYKN